MKNKLKNSRQLRGFLKFSLSTKGLTITDLAKTKGITGPSLCNAFYRPFPKAERIIADALNQQPWDVWPERYTDQKPNRPNTWYLRKSGGWLVKHIKKNSEVKGKILDKDRHETD